MTEPFPLAAGPGRDLGGSGTGLSCAVWGNSSVFLLKARCHLRSSVILPKIIFVQGDLSRGERDRSRRLCDKYHYTVSLGNDTFVSGISPFFLALLQDDKMESGCGRGTCLMPTAHCLYMWSNFSSLPGCWMPHWPTVLIFVTDETHDPLKFFNSLIGYILAGSSLLLGFCWTVEPWPWYPLGRVLRSPPCLFQSDLSLWQWSPSEKLLGLIHHWLNGHEFEQALGDGEGQGSLVCCSPWGPKELDTTERLTWTTGYINMKIVVMRLCI